MSEKSKKTTGKAAQKKAPQKKVSKKAVSKETKQLEELKESLAQEKERYLRLFAEFENFKKRTVKERIELYKTAGEDVIVELIPVIDDFERALKEVSKSQDNSGSEGVKLIYNKFFEALKSKGLEQVVVEKNDSFDSELHEAITQISAGDDQKGKIIDVIEKGYKLGDKILRYPKVVVGQ